MTESHQIYPQQREAVRVKCDIRAEVVCVTCEGQAITDDWTTGRIVSLCSGGAGLEAPIGATAGDILCLRFGMPDTEEQMNLYGRVVSASGQGIGVKFVGLSLEESAKLLRYAFRQQIRNAKNQALPHDASDAAEDEALLIPENIRRTSAPVMLDANTEVMGTVLSGARVRVAGDIRISGNVQDAEIHALGSVVIDGGFLGIGAGKIICGGDFRARFAQNQRIEAAGRVEVEKAIISSTVLTSGDVVVGPEDGTIVGGEIRAYGKVEASVIGSSRPVTTRIVVGADPLVRLAIDSMEKRAMELTTRRVGLLKRMAFASKHPGRMSQSGELTDLEAASVAIQTELAKICEEVVTLRAKSHMRPDAVVVVHQESHPPLDLSICTSQVISDSGTGPVVFRLLEDRVVLDTWSLK